jgi:hypothetical protein
MQTMAQLFQQGAVRFMEQLLPPSSDEMNPPIVRLTTRSFHRKYPEAYEDYLLANDEDEDSEDAPAPHFGEITILGQAYPTSGGYDSNADDGVLYYFPGLGWMEKSEFTLKLAGG